jgi:hypothetical protein
MSRHSADNASPERQPVSNMKTISGREMIARRLDQPLRLVRGEPPERRQRHGRSMRIGEHQPRRAPCAKTALTGV